MSSMMVRLKQKQIEKLVKKGKRPDGRDLTEIRDIEIEEGVIENAEGSTRLRLGETEVMVGVKIEVGDPYPDTPDEGVLTVNAELIPLASPDFESGPPGKQAVELARVVDRGIRESKAIDFKKLCLEPGEKVFVVFVDIYVLNHDGNLIDASALAAISALLNTKMSKYELEDGEVKMKPGSTPLSVVKNPIAVTVAKINDELIVDPGLDEEQVMDTRLTITLDDDGNICSVQKGCAGCWNPKEVLQAVDIVNQKVEEIRKKLKL